MVVPLSAWAPGESSPPTSEDDSLFWPTPDGSGSLTLTATVVIAQDGSATYSVQGTMTSFDITILDEGLQVIQIPFGNDSQPGATFSSSTGSKTSIQVNVGTPTFLGPLAFVNQLQDFLKNIGGSGLSIDVEPTSVSVSVKLALPSVGCGVFDLENLALSAGVMVPFLDGATVATFGFCSQEQPFTLTVMCFGGGGYVLLSVGLGGGRHHRHVCQPGRDDAHGLRQDRRLGLRPRDRLDQPQRRADARLYDAEHGHRHGDDAALGEHLLLLGVGRRHDHEVLPGRIEQRTAPERAARGGERTVHQPVPATERAHLRRHRVQRDDDAD
jgi:hypothetical protein